MSKKKDAATTPAVPEAERLTSLRDHPTAGPAIRRARAVGGLGGFAVAAMIGFDGGSPFALTVERALEVGIASQTVAWAAAVLVWKRILIAQAGAVARSLKRPTGA
jgi:hypothetical protein